MLSTNLFQPPRRRFKLAQDFGHFPDVSDDSPDLSPEFWDKLPGTNQAPIEVPEVTPAPRDSFDIDAGPEVWNTNAAPRLSDQEIKAIVASGARIGLAPLAALAAVGALGGARAPRGHRAEGGFRAIKRLGHVAAGTGAGLFLGGVAGALAPAAITGDSPADGTAPAVGTVLGGLAGAYLGNKSFDWTMPPPTWERRNRESR